MTETQRTLDEIRQEGFEALIERLGKADAVRFMQQFSHGEGDYATERHDWVDKITLEDIKEAAKPIDAPRDGNCQERPRVRE